MPKTHLLKLPDFSVWIRIRIQIGIFIVGYLCIIFKASHWGSLLGPRLFLWPCILFYLSVFATPITSMLQILILGLIHDSIFNLPLGLSSFTWITWHWFLAKQHRQLLKASIPILWGTFAGTLFILNVIEYIILVKSKLAVSQTYFIFETLIQIGFFPIITHFFHLYLFRLGKFK